MTPHYVDDTVTLYHGDCLDVLRELPDNSVDAVITDPPYGISFMGREWDQPDQYGSRRRGGSDRPFSAGPVGIDHLTTTERSASMHAGKYDLSRSAMLSFHLWCTEWTTECLRVLKPGGHLLSFGGSRTWHRLASAVEDAGFEIRDSIAWLYGSGFPKSLDVSKAIDKARRRDYVLAAIDLGLDVPGNNLHDWTKAEHSPGDAWWEKFKAHLSPEDWQSIERQVTRAASRKNAPGQTITFDQRSSTERERRDIPATEDAQQWQGWGTALKPAFEPIVVGRKPLSGTVAANVLEYGTGALNIDACRVGTSDTLVRPEIVRRDNEVYGKGLGAGIQSEPAGRWPTNVVLDESQAAELDKQTGILTSGSRTAGTYGLMGYMGADAAPMPAVQGDSGGASRFFPVFRYEAKAPTSERPRDGEVAHPTVKPLDLMRWLVRLVTPPGGTVLEPFAGSGTTAEACVIEGFKCIAIEREADYLPLIVNRLSKPIQMGLGFEADSDGARFRGWWCRVTRPDVVEMVRELCEPTVHVARYDPERAVLKPAEPPRLSKGRQRRRKAGRSAGRAPRYHRTTHPGLLEQLWSSVEPSGSVEAGAARPAASRPAARLDAIDTANRIDTQVGIWLDDLGVDFVPVDRDPGKPLTESEVRLLDSVARLRHLASLIPGLDHCGRRTPERHRRTRRPVCCNPHELEHDIAAWWTWARVVTGWDTPAFQPNNTCPLCGSRGTLRVRLEQQRATCVNDACRETWDETNIGLLAAHIRSENGEQETA